jgi:hypothetical protein
MAIMRAALAGAAALKGLATGARPAERRAPVLAVIAAIVTSDRDYARAKVPRMVLQEACILTAILS